MSAEPEFVTCPHCDSDDLTVTTYAYHSLRHDPFGMQFDHFDWSDEWAIECSSCGWSEGNTSSPDLTTSVDEVIGAKKIERIREQFIQEARASNE